MKNLFVTLFAILLSTIIYAQDFQLFKFGDSIEKIMKEVDPNTSLSESTSDSGMEFIMSQKEEVTDSYAGIKSRVAYYFLDHKLEGVRFFTAESHDDLNEYLKDYKKIEDYLTQKYKKIETREFWDNETYRNDPSKLALAISLGHYSISNTYKDGTTEIVHILTNYYSIDRPIYQMIDYSSETCMKFYKNNSSEGKDVLRRTK